MPIRNAGTRFDKIGVSLSAKPLETLLVPKEKDECVDSVSDPIIVEPGVLSASMDADRQSLTVKYDPKQISDESVRKIFDRIAPQAERRFDKCLMHLNGRACEACALNFEKEAEKIRGIRSATATFIGGVMSVTFDNTVLSQDQIVESIRETGAPVDPYSLSRERPRNLREWFSLHRERIEIVCTVLTLVFMLTGWLSQRFGLGHGWVTAFFVAAYLTGGIFGVQASIQSLRQWTLDVDLLMVLAALGAAYVGAPFEGAMLLFLFSLSNVLQAFAIERTRRAIHSLIKLRPETALVKRGGDTVNLPVAELAVGDVVIVRPGESIPLDSMITEGESAIDESSITGESIPVSKHAGDPVFAATINQTGGIEVRVERLARDSTIEKLIRMVEEAQSEKADTQRFLDRAEQYYAAGVICFTIAVVLGSMFILHEAFGAAFYRAMTVMVVASPCALIISTPASILSAIGGAARSGVLFKGGVHLERTAGIKIVAFDKTGTLTQGKPRVTDVVWEGKVFRPTQDLPTGARVMLQIVASVEAKSEHPLARAITAYAREIGLTLFECADFQSTSGQGVGGMVAGRRIAVCNSRYLDAHGGSIGSSIAGRMQSLENDGKTCVFAVEMTRRGPVILGLLAIADVLREEASEVVRELKAMGLKRIVMVTGDNPRVATAIAREAGIDEYHAGLLPEDKVRVIKSLKAGGPVAMVGDGINDAPALATATVGVAMGAAGTDIAMETADLVLMSDNLHNIPFAIFISRMSRAVVQQNLAFALLVIVALVTSALCLSLSLPIGVLGHEGSTVLVCLNGLRLLGMRRAPAGVG